MDKEKEANKHFWRECGKKMAKRRKELGLSRNRVSESVGISEKDLGQIERGEHGCGMARLTAIAKVLNLPMDELTLDVPLLADTDPQKRQEVLDRLLALFSGCTTEELESLFQLNFDLMKYIKRARRGDYEDRHL